jgi:hypothetical protein
MPYIPKSRIQTNLYTPGKEFYVPNIYPEYIGYYHKLYTGKIYTGKNPDDKPNYQLIAIKEYTIPDETNIPSQLELSIDYENFVYTQLKNIPLDLSVSLPQLYLTQPTEQDYKLGEFRRYFCKKRNEFTYIEISKSDYDKLVKKDPTIDFTSWFPFNIPWSLTGDKDKVGQTNKNIVLLQINKDKLYGFDKYLKGDYLKYYKA